MMHRARWRWGYAVLAVPYIHPADGANEALVLSAPGSGEGTAAVQSNSRLWGVDGNVIARANLGKTVDLDLLAGFRYLSLTESLSLATTTTTAVPGVFDGAVTPPGSTYVGFDRWLAGQTWSNFQDVAALPDTVDFLGPTEGTIFVRQAQLRYTRGPWSIAIENPETTITPYLNNAARISSDDNLAPDFTARWLTRGEWGHFTVAGLLRQWADGRWHTRRGPTSSRPAAVPSRRRCGRP